MQSIDYINMYNNYIIILLGFMYMNLKYLYYYNNEKNNVYLSTNAVKYECYNIKS